MRISCFFKSRKASVFFLLVIGLMTTIYLSSENKGETDMLLAFGGKESGLTFPCRDGQLGNRMFYYAIVYGISRLNNRQGLIQRCNTHTCNFDFGSCTINTTLHDIFHLTLPVVPDLPKIMQRGHDIQYHQRFPADYNVAKSANVLTGELFPFSMTHFLHVRDEIRREFRFREEFEAYASRVLQQAKGTRNSSTYVSVHVRRGDFLRFLKMINIPQVPLEFFEYGMRYFRLKFKDAVFVVVSDDLPWCRTHILGDDVFILETMGSPAQDMAVLSSCQHSIFDHGSYGTWGAFLAGGQVLFYEDGVTSFLAAETASTKKSYPPEWIGISQDMLNAMKTNT